MSRRKWPEEIWIIFDPLDGPHLFTNEYQARRTFKSWEKEALINASDSFWDMSGPIRFVLSKKK